MLQASGSGRHVAGRALHRVSMKRVACLAAAIALANLIGLAAAAAGQLTILHRFRGTDGAGPRGLVMDAKGALFGTAGEGGDFVCGIFGCGTVFRLAPPAAGETHPIEKVLHRFRMTGGHGPTALTMDASGALFGTTTAGGGANCAGIGCGTVFELTPPAAGETRWTQTLLHKFGGGFHGDGEDPFGGLIVDASGALFGATVRGGRFDGGTVFMLTPPAAGQTGWTETLLYSFTGGADGALPVAGLIVDANGALFGTTAEGGGTGCSGFGCGTVFMLTPPSAGKTGWAETLLYSFKGGTDGTVPEAGLIMDTSGALFGTTREGGGSDCGGSGCGTVFMLTPPAAGKTGWSETLLYAFAGGADGASPAAELIMDTSGTLFGTTEAGGGSGCRGFGCGTVFMVTPPSAGKTGWSETPLYSFTGRADGAFPEAGLIMDAGGALYGTTTARAGHCPIDGGCGTVFKLVP